MAAFNLGDIFVTLKAKSEGVTETFKKVDDGVAGADEKIGTFKDKMSGVATGFVALGAVGAGALFAIRQGVDQAIGAANRLDASMIGLTSIANAFGADATKAKVAAQQLASDGLMSVSDAASGLKNLLASGFSLPQAIELMTRFKDTSAFGRQGALSFGEAIVGATEGIKNGNSILVDNVGVTKNLSMILEEAGFKATDLMKATTDANVRQALFNGLIKETGPMLGDAARYSDTFAGAQSRAAAETEKTNQKVGKALQPALTKILEVMTPVVTKIGEWVEKNPQLATAIIAISAGMAALAVVLGVVGAAFLFVTTVGAPVLGIAAAIIVGIGLLIAAGVLLYKNWENIKAGAEMTWGAIRDFIMGIWEWITGSIGDVVTSITDAWNQFSADFMAIWNGVVDFLAGVWAGIAQGASDMATAIWNFIKPVVDFIIAYYQLMWDVFYYVFSVMRGLIIVIWDFIWNNVIKPVIDLIVGYFRWLGDVMSAVWNAVSAAAVATWNWIWAVAIKPVIDSIVGAANWLGGVLAGVWNWISSGAATAWQAISSWASWAWNGVVGVWNGVVGFFSGIWNQLSSGMGTLANGIANGFRSAFEGAKGIVKGAVNFMIDMANNVIRGLNNTAGKLPGVPKINEIPKFARGVRNFVGGMAIINEQGPELVQLPTGSNVYSAGQTQQMLSNAGGGSGGPVINVDLSGANITSPAVAEEYAEVIGDMIVRKLQNNTRV